MMYLLKSNHSRNRKNRSVVRSLAVVMAAALLLSPLGAGAIEFSEDDLNKLKAGETLYRELENSGNKGFYGGSGWAVVDAPVDVVWKAITDWDAYTKMFPNTTEATELSQKDNKSLVRFKLGHPLVSLTYHTEMVEDGKKHMLSFRLVKSHPNDVDSIRGYWRLFPQKGGRTLVAYVVAVKVPMGLVNLVGPDLERRAVIALLRIPGDVKKWVEGPAGEKYK